MTYRPWALLLTAGVAALFATVAATAAPGSPLLFVSNRDGNAQIYRMNAGGADERALTRGTQENSEPAWSPDGTRIAFTSYRDGNAEVYLMDADGGNPRRLTTEPQSDNAPVWTPDGRIVFRSMRSRWANFYVMDADGTNLRQLTHTESDKGMPTLSPDGRWIAYVAHGEKGSSEIHVMPAGGGESRNLTAALSRNQKTFPCWSPDSRRLAYVEASSGTLNIRSIEPSGANPVKITDNSYVNAYPTWSPDGARIAFASGRDGSRSERARADIFVMNTDGSGAANLTRHPDEDNYPAWSADGRAIFFVSLRDGNAQIYAVPASGGEAQRLTRNPGYDLMVRPLALRGASAGITALAPPSAR